jgi:uncharacterized protein (DUF779 family)
VAAGPDTSCAPPQLTEAARDLLRQMRARHGDVAIFISGGCCDGSSPICLPAGELLAGPQDLLLGDVDGVPVSIDAEQYRRFGTPELLIDASRGAGEGFSLDSLETDHLVLGSCPRPQATRKEEDHG